MEQESKYLATLFEKTAADAQSLLDGPLKQAASFLSQNTDLRQLIQNQSTSSGLQPETTSTSYQHQSSSYTIDYSNLDSNRHHAIVIPYRDRKFHLEQFIEHMGPYLKRNFPHDTFELWIIEQDDPHLFNRAWLANVGIANIKLQIRNFKYQVAQQQAHIAEYPGSSLPVTVPPPPRCIILHDVDLIPTVDGVPYTNCSRPIQLGTELAHFNNSIPYPIYTGGVGPSMLLAHWEKINGMSNDFYGKILIAICGRQSVDENNWIERLSHCLLILLLYRMGWGRRRFVAPTAAERSFEKAGATTDAATGPQWQALQRTEILASRN